MHPSPPPRFTISPATPSDLPAIRTLFTAYTTWLDLDLSFQSFSAELASLPGAYDPPDGRLYIARSTAAGSEPLGCVALRPLPYAAPDERRTGEVKRLYVVPEARGWGVGRALAETVVKGAREAKYAALMLDTLPRMEGAIAMYRKLGWRECGRYYDTPVEGTVFMRLDVGE